MKQKISFVPLDADLQLWLLEKLLKEPPQSPYTAEFLQGVRNLICGQTSSLLLGIPEQKGVVEQGLSENIVVGELEISPKNRKVILQGKEISLTPKEFDILYFLVENRGGVLFNDLPAHFSGAELAAVQAKYIGLFQAGWFVESMWSQTLVIHMIRTPKLPFLQSRASAPVTLLTMAGIVVLTIIPFTGFGAMLGFTSLPIVYFAYLIPCIVLYMALATSLKKAYVRHYGELL